MNDDYLKLQVEGSAWTTQSPHYQDMLKEVIDWVIPNLSKIKANNVLDIGCGDGWGVEYWTKQGIDIHGGDISEEKIEAAHKRGITSVGYMDMHEIPDHWSDIVCSHTLEHSHDFKLAIDSMVNALDNGGRLFIVIPVEPIDPRPANPSHTQYFASETILRDYLKSKPEISIIYEEVKKRDTIEYWVIVEKQYEQS